MIASVVLIAVMGSSRAAAEDGVYGRLDGDLALSLEAGVSEAIGAAVQGESLAVRLGAHYLHTVGLYGQYNDALGIDALPLARALSGGVELRPLFLARWAQGSEEGPAHVDLLLDSIGLGLGVYSAWPRPRQCPPDGACADFGMEASLGLELSLLAQASTPFIALRGGVRWSLRDDTPPGPPQGLPRGAPTGLVTLSIGYHHLFEAHLVDLADMMPP